MAGKHRSAISIGITFAIFFLLIAGKTFPRSSSNQAKDFSRVTKLETSDWETCHNEKAGYEFRYPGGWYVYGDGAWAAETPILIATTSCTGSSVQILDEAPPVLKRSEIGIDIRVEQEEYLQSLNGIPKGPSVTDQMMLEAYAATTSVKRVLIDGVRFVSFPSEGSMEYAALKDHRFYSILPHPQLQRGVFEAMLASFKFLQ